MSKFTQYDWFINRYGDVVDSRGAVIAEIHYGCDRSNEECDANARAIKAVPEMYRALEELIPILESDNRLVIAYSIKRLLERIDGTDGDTEVKS